MNSSNSKNTNSSNDGEIKINELNSLQLLVNKILTEMYNDYSILLFF